MKRRGLILAIFGHCGDYFSHHEATVLYSGLLVVSHGMNWRERKLELGWYLENK